MAQVIEKKTFYWLNGSTIWSAEATKLKMSKRFENGWYRVVGSEKVIKEYETAEKATSAFEALKKELHR